MARLRRGSTGAGQPDTGQRRAEARVPHSDGSRHRGHSHLLRYLVIWIWILSYHPHLKYLVLRRCLCLMPVPQRGWV